MHRLLNRQIKKLFGSQHPDDEVWNAFIKLIDESYHEFQSDYNKLERILELSSKESFKELSNFKQAIDTAALVSLTDAKGDILKANQNFCKLSGYSIGELIGKNHNIINSGFHDKTFWKEMWRCIGSGKIWQSEVCNRKKNGELYWVDSTVIPFLNDEGKPYQYLSIRFDISDRKKIEEEIKTLALVAKKTQNAVIITDTEVRTIWTNDGFERLTGYSFEEIEGKKPGRVLQGKETDPETKKAISLAIKKAEPYSGEIINYTKAGVKYWVSISITPIFENGIHIGFIAIESDVTQKKEFEIQLKENEEKFRLLIESATDIFYNTNAQGNFTYVNDIATQITGYSNKELLQMNFLDLVKPDYRTTVRDFYLNQSLKNQKVTYFEFPITTKKGHTAWIGQNVQLINSSAKDRSIQAIARDITSLKDAQIEIENSHNFLNQIINSIPNPVFVKDQSHEWVIVNDAYSKLTGIPRKNIVGKTDLEFLEKEEAKVFMDQDDAQLKSGEEKVREVDFTDAEGNLKILLVKKSVFLNQDKKYLIGVITDITEIKERENQILLYNKISDQISDSISVADYNGNLVYVNETHARNLGKSKEQLIHSNITSMEKVFPTLDKWQEHYDEVKTKGEVLIEGENIRADKTSFPVEASVKYVRIENKGYIVATLRDITERKKNEEVLKNLKEFYENVLNKIPSEVVVFDKEHRYLFVNETAIKDPVKRNWIINHNDFEYCKQFDKPISMAEERRKLFDKSISSKAMFEFEEEVKSPAGSTVHILRRFYPILNASNEVLHVIGFGIDITSRKNAETLTKESEERLKLATQSAKLGIWDWDIQNDKLVWDESMFDIFEVNPLSFKHNVEAFKLTLHPEDAERVQADLKASLEKGFDFKNNFRIIGSKGNIKHIAAFSKTFYDSENKAKRMIGVNYDVTENTLIQEKILKQQKELEEAQHIARLGAWEIEIKSRSITWSKEMFNLCEQDESIQPSLNETYSMFTPQTRENIIQAFYDAIESQKSFELEAQLKTAKGNIIDVKAKGIPIVENERLVGIRGIFQDISAEKEANRLLMQYTHELEKKNKELDQFAYVVSHDLKAPLRGINNLSMWIEEDIGEQIDGDTKNNLDLMRKRVKRMESLIDGILQYSRAGRIKHEKESFEVKEVLEDIIGGLGAGVQFKFEVQDQMPTLCSEKISFEQVMSNYISNAVKYNSNPEPVIKITFELKNNFYEFCVADNGPGIEPEFHDKVFVIFQTLQARDKFESTGVGLAIVKKMVEEKGGKVWIESEKGQGAKFFFSWPAIESND